MTDELIHAIRLRFCGLALYRQIYLSLIRPNDRVSRCPISRVLHCGDHG